MMNLCICTGSGSSLLDNGTKISCAGTNNYLYLSSLMKFITLVFEDNYKEIIRRACADPEGGAGVRTPPPHPGKLQKYRFPSNTGLDPLKITKLPSQHSMLGHHRPASETPPANNGIWIFPPLIKLNKSCQSWTSSDKTFWIRARRVQQKACKITWHAKF